MRVGLFYGGQAAVLVGVAFEVWPATLPEWVAGPAARNSEALLLAMLLAAWIEFARPHLVSRPARRRCVVTTATAATCLLAATVLLVGDLPSRFRTLNEPFLVAAVLIPALQARRPPPVRVAVGITLATLVIVAATSQTAPVIHLAEALGVAQSTGWWVRSRAMAYARSRRSGACCSSSCISPSGAASGSPADHSPAPTIAVTAISTLIFG
ncbi:hypothetical protein ABN034_08165 [Actinopolymorpha sp. B11F2]|uniref:hypothetical protein n=1 Tax=Actinopolymorpha sp. B11F2 TaxID=3160862 RepID=UPI0032E379DA